MSVLIGGSLFGGRNPQAIKLSILSDTDQISKHNLQTIKSIVCKGINSFFLCIVETARIEHLIGHSRQCHNR